MLVVNNFIERCAKSVVERPRDEKKLEKLRNALGDSVVKWMKIIAESNKEAMDNYKKDKTLIQKNIWYAEDHLKACESLSPKMTAYIRKNKFQVTGRLNPNYFDITKDEKQNHMHYIAKKTVLASDALMEAIKGLTIIDCGIACRIAQYGALLDVLEIDKFNRLFGSAVGQSMNLNSTDGSDLQPMMYFVEVTFSAFKLGVGKIGNRPIKKGQTGAIEGADNYTDKFPFGIGGNMNVTCYDDTPGKQTFLGLGLNPEGESESEICEWLLKDYNQIKNPFFRSAVKDHWEPSEVKAIEKEVSKKFPPAKQVKGFNSESVEDFKAEIIYDLIEMPLEEVTMDFVKKNSKPMHLILDELGL
jgi:uncharacterized protein (UPF0305 family)